MQDKIIWMNGLDDIEQGKTIKMYMLKGDNEKYIITISNDTGNNSSEILCFVEYDGNNALLSI